MIQPRSMLDVADNSGAKRVQCIRVMGGANKRYASLGDTVIVAVKEAAPDGTVKKGEVARAVVVRTVKEVGRTDGGCMRCERNAVVLIEPDENPLPPRSVVQAARDPRDRPLRPVTGLARAAQGRVVHPLRPQRGRAHQAGREPGRDAYLRAGRARAPRAAVHEDHLARAGGHLMGSTFTGSPRLAAAARTATFTGSPRTAGPGVTGSPRLRLRLALRPRAIQRSARP